jgi:hypothetical protein
VADAADVPGGGSGVYIDYTGFGAACGKVRAAASALAEACDRIGRAEKAPQDGDFGMSPEAHAVVRYWITALDQRGAELRQCMEQAAGMYGLMELAGRRYREADDDSSNALHRVDVNGVDPAFERQTYNELSKPPGQLTQPKDDVGGSITQDLRGIEAPGSGSASGDGGSDSAGALESGGGADDEE